MAHSTVDYSKWDNFEDSDEEREKERKAGVDRDIKNFQTNRERNREEVDDSRKGKLRSKLVESGLFQDLLTPFTPEHFLELRWGGDNIAFFGNFLACKVLKKRPKLTYECPDEDRYHTAIFFAVPDFLSVDQIRTLDDEPEPVESTVECLAEDAARRAAEANRKQFVHWVRINIKGPSDVTGEDVVEYLPPCPQRLQGFFRYFLVLCRQVGRIGAWTGPRAKKMSIKGRDQFDAAGVLQAHKLRPISANLIRTSWDESSDETRASIQDT
eukprot:EG_transcript_20562